MKFIFHDLIDSTHLFAKKFIDDNLINEDILISANKMINGQSTKKNVSWFSPEGNLYFSIIFNRKYNHQDSQSLIFCSSLATINFILSISNILIKNIKIKWPNDILINEKKISGSMAEIYKNYLILSIGINLIKYPKKTNNFPATSILNENASFIYQKYDNKKYAISLYFFLIEEIKKFDNFGFDKLRKSWKKYAYKLNKKISFQDEKGIKKSKFIDIECDGSLILEDSFGNKYKKYYGEIFFT